MKKIIACCVLAISALVCSVEITSLPSKATKQANKPQSSIVGRWKWSNCSYFDFPVYYEFKTDGTMLAIFMRPEKKDVERFKYTRSGNTIYYTKPAADEPVVNEMTIVKLTGNTLILREIGSDGQKIEMWLERSR